MKRKALLLISLATIAFNNSIIIVNADTTNHSDEKRAEKFFKKIKNFNQKINQDILDKTVAANRTLKNKYQSTNEETLNLNRYWTTFIKKINYLKNDQLEIYVTADFKKLSQSKRSQIIEFTQQLALSQLDTFKAVSDLAYGESLAITIFCDGNYLGRSLFMNNKEFRWKS